MEDKSLYLWIILKNPPVHLSSAAENSFWQHFLSRVTEKQVWYLQIRYNLPSIFNPRPNDRLTAHWNFLASICRAPGGRSNTKTRSSGDRTRTIVLSPQQPPPHSPLLLLAPAHRPPPHRTGSSSLMGTDSPQPGEGASAPQGAAGTAAPGQAPSRGSQPRYPGAARHTRTCRSRRGPPGEERPLCARPCGSRHRPQRAVPSHSPRRRWGWGHLPPLPAGQGRRWTGNVIWRWRWQLSLARRRNATRGGRRTSGARRLQRPRRGPRHPGPAPRSRRAAPAAPRSTPPAPAASAAPSDRISPSLSPAGGDAAGPAPPPPTPSPPGRRRRRSRRSRRRRGGSGRKRGSRRRRPLLPPPHCPRSPPTCSAPPRLPPSRKAPARRYRRAAAAAACTSASLPRTCRLKLLMAQRRSRPRRREGRAQTGGGRRQPRGGSARLGTPQHAPPLPPPPRPRSGAEPSREQPEGAALLAAEPPGRPGASRAREAAPRCQRSQSGMCPRQGAPRRLPEDFGCRVVYGFFFF